MLNGASTNVFELDSARVPVALVQEALNETVTTEPTLLYLSSRVRPVNVNPLIEKSDDTRRDLGVGGRDCRVDISLRGRMRR